ncbi:hypothetical protein B0J13DRAFT_554746 [Dactylonectria estremocensis]|uniref:Arrestin-like N-terminal domain-containing protein n=1 Tax=Dactylonectria estremocensis TaxID=1079267 RepID=A0A9P9EUE1_9HYPO|nr:hypothetical protein B0J13DRAFT_554746 [Dactylonectria estremocensis]
MQSTQWDIKAFGLKFKNHRRNQDLGISLHHDYASRVYTSGSSVAGELKITPRKDVKFDVVRVCLSGDGSVLHEDIGTASVVRFGFLDIEMPLPLAALPESRIFEVGQQYKIPFEFVVPYQLASATCSHPTTSQSLRDHHLRLPPTTGKWEKADMTPNTTEIQYKIKASVMRYARADSKTEPSPVMETSKSILVIPSSQEDPPLSLSILDSLYTTNKKITIRKSLLSKALGSVSAVATEAAPIYLGSDGRTATASTVGVALVFDPLDTDSSPPAIGQALAKIISHTWSHGRAVTNFPNLGPAMIPDSSNISVELKPVNPCVWAQHTGISGGHGSDESPPLPFYSSHIEATFELPVSTHAFTPTFHSCFISRAYSVKLDLNVGGQSIVLSVPLQVVMQGLPEKLHSDDAPPSFEEAYESSQRSRHSGISG